MKIFITRTLNQESMLKDLLPSGHDVYGESLIHITPLLLTSIPQSDWIFFYSKTGIECFFNQLDAEKIKQVSQRKFGVMGKGSDFCLTKYIHRTADFVSDDNLDESVKKFHLESQHQSVLFVKAKNSKSTFELPGNGFHSALIIYENQPKSNVAPIDAEVVIFTSPMNVIAFFSSNKPHSGNTYIAIGRSTAEALNDCHPGLKYYISKGHSEFDLAETLTEILRDR